MAKLTTKGRKRIKSSNYGLHTNGKKSYPLNDESHVRSAIQMFAHCPDAQKSTLARNIKRRIKELGMHVETSKGSSFYPYAGKYRKKENKK